jgi:hypothetical protein
MVTTKERLFRNAPYRFIYEASNKQPFTTNN